MPEEVSLESKLYVKEEIENVRKEIREDVEKVKSKATKTFSTVAIVVGLITGLGAYGSAKHYISATIKDTLGAETLKEFEKNKITAEQNMIEVKRLMVVANGNLKEIIDLKKIAYLPIGTILPSMLDPNSFAAAVGDPPVFDPVKSKWVLADGRDVTDSQYGKLFGNETPDLRGMFLRGMNVNGGQDPNQNRTAGHPQTDAFKKHSHMLPISENEGNVWGVSWSVQGEFKGEHQRWTTAEGGDETRPKNVAIYFYIRIN
jgi:hypothetical protein